MRTLKYIATGLTFLLTTLVVQAQYDDDSNNWEDQSYEDSWGDSGSDDPWGGEWGSDDDVENPFLTEEEPKGPKYKVNFQNACANRSELRNKAKLALKPYRYCNAKTTMITFRMYPQKQQLVIPIYYDLQHALIFNTEGLDQDIRVRVYDGPENDKKRKLLFEMDRGEKQSTFELAKDYKESKIFIEYTVPPSDGTADGLVSKGCVVFMMGYLDEEMADMVDR